MLALRRSRQLAKKSQLKSLNKVVLDTSYILPFLGIEVKDVDTGELVKILNGLKLFYPAVLIAELEGVILKELRKHEMKSLPKEVLEGFDSLMLKGEVNVILPDSEELKIVHEIVSKGWKDIFDASAYALALTLDAFFLTLDKTFKNFLKQKNFEHERLISHKELVKISKTS